MPLFKLLAIKSFAEVAFISALAAVYYFNTAPPTYRGWSQTTERGVAGWAVEKNLASAFAAASPASRRVEVQLEINGRLTAGVAADLPRPDVAAYLARSSSAIGRAPIDERCGFEFDLGALESGNYDAQVYAVHRQEGRAARLTLIPVGPRLRLRVEGGRRFVARDEVEGAPF